MSEPTQEAIALYKEYRDIMNKIKEIIKGREYDSTLDYAEPMRLQGQANKIMKNPLFITLIQPKWDEFLLKAKEEIVPLSELEYHGTTDYRQREAAVEKLNKYFKYNTNSTTSAAASTLAVSSSTSAAASTPAVSSSTSAAASKANDEVAEPEETTATPLLQKNQKKKGFSFWSSGGKRSKKTKKTRKPKKCRRRTQRRSAKK